MPTQFENTSQTTSNSLLLSYSSERVGSPPCALFRNAKYQMKGMRSQLLDDLSLSPPHRPRAGLSHFFQFQNDGPGGWSNQMRRGAGLKRKERAELSSLMSKEQSEKCLKSIFVRSPASKNETKNHSKLKRNRPDRETLSPKPLRQSGSGSPHQSSPNLRSEIFQFVRGYLRRSKLKSLPKGLAIGRNYSAVYQSLGHVRDHRGPGRRAETQTGGLTRRAEANEPDSGFCAETHFKFKIKANRNLEYKENTFHQNHPTTTHLGKRPQIEAKGTRRGPGADTKCKDRLQSGPRKGSDRDLGSGLKAVKTITGCDRTETKNQRIELNLSKQVDLRNNSSKEMILEKIENPTKNPIFIFSEKNERFESESGTEPNLNAGLRSQLILNFEHFDCSSLDRALRPQRESDLTAFLSNIQRNFQITSSSVNCAENALLLQRLFVDLPPHVFRGIPLDSQLIVLTRLWFQLVDDKWHSRTFHPVLTKVNIKSTKQLSKLTKEYAYFGLIPRHFARVKASSARPDHERSTQLFRKILVSLISICTLTETFVDLSLDRPSRDSEHNQQLIRLKMRGVPVAQYQKLETDPRLLDMSLQQLIGLFDMNMFLNFVFMSTLRFRKAPRLESLRLLWGPGVVSLPFTVQTQRSMFTVKRKRKDDLMNSILKYIQKQLFQQFKRDRSTLSLAELKAAFKRHYFEGDEPGAKAYYSSLFNRKSLARLRQNRRLMRDVKGFYARNGVERLVNDRFFEHAQVSAFDLQSDKLFSKRFVKSLSKKQVNLLDLWDTYYFLRKLLVD